MRITVILTCFNRRDKTYRCIQSLLDGNPSLEFEFIIVDDASTDGTLEMLEGLRHNGAAITVIHGTGVLYWAGGMRIGIDYAHANNDSDIYMLANDDVEFMEHSIESMLAQKREGEVLIGPTCDKNGELTYGGIRYNGKGIHYSIVGPEDIERECDTFNANCVLIPKEIFFSVGNIDLAYIHSLGDFDYGLSMKRMGIQLRVAGLYIGTCSNNPIEGSWEDRSLQIRERIRKKEDIKGAPWKPWFHFLRKNFGLGRALIHSLTPYLRILSKH